MGTSWHSEEIRIYILGSNNDTFDLSMEMVGPDGRSDGNLTAEITFPSAIDGLDEFIWNLTNYISTYMHLFIGLGCEN